MKILLEHCTLAACTPLFEIRNPLPPPEVGLVSAILALHFSASKKIAHTLNFESSGIRVLQISNPVLQRRLSLASLGF